MLIRNKDVIERHYDELRERPRPGHGDLSLFLKYGPFRNYSGGGFLSGRITAPLVAAGSIQLRNEKLEEYLGKKNIVTTGFYGLDESGNIAIAGRNSSDYVASVLAVKFGADELVLFKDVDGIYRADPRLISSISPIGEMDYEEATKYSIEGGIIHPDAVRICGENNVIIHVMGYHSLKIGTIVRPFVNGKTKLYFPETA